MTDIYGTAKPTFAERCQLAEQCLPDAPYRAMLKKLHTEMLEALTEQPAQQQPVAYLVDGDLYYPEEIDWETLQEQGHTVAALYTSLPAQRKPLTLGQKQRLWSSVGDKPTLKDRVNAYGLAIEAAHGIKENT